MSEERKQRWVGATIRLPEDERAALIAAARDHGSITAVIRAAVKMYLAQPTRRQASKQMR